MTIGVRMFWKQKVSRMCAIKTNVRFEPEEIDLKNEIKCEKLKICNPEMIRRKLQQAEVIQKEDKEARD